MKTKVIIFCLATGLLFVCGCKDKTTNSTPSPTTIVEKIAPNVVDAKIGDVIVDLTGKKYRKVTDEIIERNGFSMPDTWERVGESKSWYTPTLDSKLNKNSAPMFNSLSR